MSIHTAFSVFQMLLILGPVLAGTPALHHGSAYSLRRARRVERLAAIAFAVLFNAELAVVITVLQPWPAVAVLLIKIPAFFMVRAGVRRIVELATNDHSKRKPSRLLEWLRGADIPDEETLRLKASVPSTKDQIEASDAAVRAAQGLSEPSSGDGALAIVDGGNS